LPPPPVSTANTHMHMGLMELDIDTMSAAAATPSHRRECCLRCAKAQGSNPGLVCARRHAEAAKCERCRAGRKPCLSVPQSQVRAANELLRLSDRVAKAQSRGSADAADLEAELVQLQRQFTMVVEAVVRRETPRRESARFRGPSTKELLQSILAGVQETNSLLRAMVSAPFFPVASHSLHWC
jgi:hypothetical protein